MLLAMNPLQQRAAKNIQSFLPPVVEEVLPFLDRAFFPSCFNGGLFLQSWTGRQVFFLFFLIWEWRRPLLSFFFPFCPHRARRSFPPQSESLFPAARADCLSPFSFTSPESFFWPWRCWPQEGSFFFSLPTKARTVSNRAVMGVSVFFLPRARSQYRNFEGSSSFLFSFPLRSLEPPSPPPPHPTFFSPPDAPFPPFLEKGRRDAPHFIE